MQSDNTTSNPESKLLKACAQGDLEVVKALLVLDTNVNTQTKYNRTPLSLACWHKKNDVAKVLLDFNADVDHSDKAGNSPLHLAFSSVGTLHDTTTVVELLLERGACVNAVTNNMDTPAHLAAKSGALGSLKLLVGASADLLALNGEGRNLLQVAKIHHENEVVQFLLSENLPNRPTKRDAATAQLPPINVDAPALETPEGLLSPDLESEVRRNYAADETSEEAPGGPMSPDLISEVSTSTALQQYALFQEIVDEQFQGNMMEDDGLLLAELVEMGLNPDLDDCKDAEEDEDESEPTSSVPPTPQNVRQFRLTTENENSRLRQENDSLKETIEQYQQLLEDLQV